MTRRALLLAAALAWPGVAWGQTTGGGGFVSGIAHAINGFCPPGKSCPVDGVITRRLRGDGEYVVEPGEAVLRITLIGAGGNGSKDGTPGGSGAIRQVSMFVSPGQHIPYSIGQPGDADKPGGNTRFGDYVAYGGGSRPIGDGAKGMPGTILLESIGDATVTACPPCPTCTPHRYTPAEIDRLREAVRKRLTVVEHWQRCAGNGEVGGLARGNWLNCSSIGLMKQSVDISKPAPNAEIEDRLRTYIAAGITAEELEKQ
jgi:hypothetical protein